MRPACGNIDFHFICCSVIPLLRISSRHFAPGDRDELAGFITTMSVEHGSILRNWVNALGQDEIMRGTINVRGGETGLKCQPEEMLVLVLWRWSLRDIITTQSSLINTCAYLVVS